VRLQTFYTECLMNLCHNFTIKFLTYYRIKKSYKHEANWQQVQMRCEGIRRGGYRKHTMLFIMLLCHCMFTRSVQEGRIRPGCTVRPVLAHRQKGAGALSCWWYIERPVWCGMSFFRSAGCSSYKKYKRRLSAVICILHTVCWRFSSSIKFKIQSPISL